MFSSSAAALPVCGTQRARSVWPAPWAMASRTKGVNQSVNIQWTYPPADSAEMLMANVGQLSTSA